MTINYLPVGNYPEAMTCVRRALEGELDDNNTDIANMTMGVLYYYTDNYAEAKPYLPTRRRFCRDLRRGFPSATLRSCQQW